MLIMKISDHLLKEILEATTHDFETMGVYVRTKHHTEDGFNIDYRYNDIDNDIVGLTLFMADNPVNLTKEQEDILFLYALDLYNKELESEAEHRKRCMGGYEDEGYSLFI